MILPIFLLMLLGIVDLGRGFFIYNELVNGVREGARVATYDTASASIKSAVKSRTTLGLTDSDITITCYDQFTATAKSCAGTLALGDGVKVAANKPFYLISGRLIAILGSSINIGASAMRSIQ